MHTHVYREKDNRITGRVFQRRKKKIRCILAKEKKKKMNYDISEYIQRREREINKSISIARKIYHRRKENELI